MTENKQPSKETAAAGATTGATDEVQIAIPSPSRTPPVKRRSFQFRALMLKTLSYQKRQTFVNFCCVVLCPLLMVVLAGVFVIIFASIRSRQASAGAIMNSYLRYCSNSTANMNAVNIPLNYSDWSALTNPDNTNKVFEVNYYQLRQGGASLPCMNWYEDDYTLGSPYSKSPGAPASRDTTTLPDPLGSWFNDGYVSYPTVPQLPLPRVNTSSSSTVINIPIYGTINGAARFPWNYVFIAPGVSAGVKPQSSATYASPASFPARGAEPDQSGFLAGAPTQYYRFVPLNVNASTYLPADFFIDGGSMDQADAFLLDKLTRAVTAYEESFYPYSDASGRLAYRSPVNDNILALLSQSNITARYPFYGAVYLNRIDQASKKLDVTLQAGRVVRLDNAIGYSIGNLSFYGLRLSAAAIYPPKGVRYLYQLARMTNAFLSNANVAATITHGLRGFPFDVKYDGASPIDFAAEIGKTTYPFGLAFLLPIFVLTLVREKEDRILIMLRMNGLSTLTYYVSHYLHFMALQLVASIVFLITGFAMQLKFFTETDISVTIILLFLWANTMIGLAFLISLVFNKSRFASITTFALVVISCLISLFIGLIFNYEAPPYEWFLWPLFAFFRGLEVIGTACSSATRAPYRFSDLVGADELAVVMRFLLVESIVFFALMAYLNAVIPTEFGVPRPWHFVFTDTYAWLKSKFSKNSRVSSTEALHVNPDKLVPTDNLEMEDSDVKAERAKVEDLKLSLNTFQQYPLVIRNIRKQYATGKIANKAMCLTVDHNIVFGLLGPNGAGKSTLISMLTGTYPPSSGTAYVAGFDINTSMPDVYLNIGVCPQQDILWDDLTVGEHLLFYARMRGCTKAEEQEKVSSTLEAVRLTKFRDRLTKGLSGGEKRRLSIAIAIIGDVPVVFLDEPTTGLDPEVRRNIWDIIQTAKSDKTILLTTHSMEEADMLASKIGIMAKGVLRCLGTPLHLKRRYGRGFKLTVSFRKFKNESESKMPRDQALAQIEGLLPVNQWQKLEQGGVQGNAIYEFDDARDAGQKGGVISNLLDVLESRKQEWEIEDFGISQTSLEEVFLNIVKDEDADASEL